MSTSVPNPPSFTSPQNNYVFPEATTQATLSWTAVPGASWYALRVDDLGEPALRLPGNNCTDQQGNAINPHYLCKNNLTTTSFAVKVRPGHRYRAWVHAVNSVGYSQPAFVEFRVLVTDAAEFAFQIDQNTFLPGEQFNVLITMRNVGSTTWTPAAGYKLGSQSPQDNITWGTNRINLPANAQVPPGATIEFFAPLKAPTTAGVYDLQWQMLREGVRWFGEFTRNVRVTVRPAVVPAGKLTRNASNGRIMADGNAVVLRGGHYDLFQKDSKCTRNLTRTPGAVPPFIVAYKEGVEPCNPGGAPVAYALQWWGTGDNWGGLFKWLRRTNTNLLRIWLSGGTRIENGRPTDLTPFVLDSAGKYQVSAAINYPHQWNTEFFNRLSAFAQLAEQNGVYLQITLFNYADLVNHPASDTRYQTWSKSFWNPEMSSDLTFGRTHLVNPAPYTCCGDPKPGYLCGDALPKPPDANASDAKKREYELLIQEFRRQCFFISPPANSNLRLVQSAIVTRVVQALSNRKNIILEVMNEPHRGALGDRAKFNSKVVNWILQGASPWRPLISVNASGFPYGGVGDTDMDWWKAYSGVPGNDAPGYNDVDIISYHGLSGYVQKETVCGVDDIDVVAVDQASINRRILAHRAKHPNKAVMFSTDAVRAPKLSHIYTINGFKDELHLRDGQIVTTYLEHYAKPSVISDLTDWAYWCFKEGAPTPGYVHFQNHSTFDVPYSAIAAAWQRANPS